MQTFKKTEKLSGKIDTENLFSNGDSFFLPPFRIALIKDDNLFKEEPLRLLVIVPKKKISLAVNRNKIKRCIREAFRKNKKILISNLKLKNKKLDFALIYQPKNLSSCNTIEIKVKEIISRLSDSL